MSVTTKDTAASAAAVHAAKIGAAAMPLRIAIFFALAAGLAETAILMFRRVFLDQFVWAGPEVVWMAPLSYLLFLVPPAFVFLLPWLSKRPNLANAAFALMLMMLVTLVLIDVALGARIHAVARLLLAAGCAVQLARWAFARPQAFSRLVQRGMPIMAACIVALGLVVEGWRIGQERFGLMKLAAARAGAPNVVFIILDTVRAATMSLYGYEYPTTPQLEHFARRGVTFERAIVTAPWTLPSHASMFTGHLPHEMSASWFTALDERYPTLAEAMRSRGYATAAFAANFYFATPETGLARGFLRFQTYPRTLRQVVLSSGLGQALEEFRRGSAINERRADRKTAQEVNAEFLGWARRQDDRPFFAVLNYFDAHKPYHAVAPFSEQFGVRGEKRYASSIAYLDYQLGVLFRELDEMEMLDNTVVIVTSDHGELFGEGKPQGGSTTEVRANQSCPCGHGGRPFMPVLNVPLLVVAPGTPANLRVSQPVSLRDIPATVLDLVDARDAQSFPGASLARFWSGDTPNMPPQPILSAARTETELRENGLNAPYTYSLVGDSLHYIRYPDGREQLFNHRIDPDERHDLATEGRQADLSIFRSTLRAMIPGAQLSKSP